MPLYIYISTAQNVQKYALSFKWRRNCLNVWKDIKNYPFGIKSNNEQH